MRAFFLLTPLLFACGSTTELEAGSFRVRSGDDGRTLSITHPSGLELSTIAGSAIAFRTADATFEMQFGAFKIDELAPDPWRTGVRFDALEQDEGAGRAVVLDDAGEELAILEVAEVQGSLRLTFTPSGGAMNRSRLQLGCDPAESGGFLGFGAQTHDADHRGQRVPIWVSEQGIGKVDTDELPELWPLIGTRHSSYLPVPTMVAPRAATSWGLHATTFRRSIWDLCAEDPSVLSIEVWEGKLEVLISPGPSPLDVVKQQTEHTGRPPLGPDWTFGVWMERIGGSALVLEEAALLRRERIPASAIWSEDWRGGKREGRSYVLDEDWRLDRALYTGAEQMIESLHAAGLKFMVYFNTFATEGVDVFDELRDGGHLVVDRRGDPIIFDGVKFTPTGLAELHRSETRDFVRRELEAAVALGADGWMADFAEWYPADPREVTPAGGLDPQEAHHRYPLEWTRLNREVIEASDRELVVFFRSGYTGSQGLAPVIWAGDQRTDFQEDDGLPTVVPIMLGLGAAGFPIVTHDIAGYISATNPPADKELFLRWTALGALGPVMRTHHGRDADFNWRWSSDPETIAIFRRWAELHTRWFPLWKALAAEASETGAPIQRPLAFHDPGDRSLHGVKDQYLIGDGILVAPVLTASTATREVKLPRGKWFDIERFSEPLDGGTTVRLPAPLGEAIVLARAGAILPLLPEGVQSLAPSDAVLDLDEVRTRRELRVWLGAPGAMREAEGGRYRLESAQEVSPPLTLVSGGTQSSSSARSLGLVVAPNSRVEVEDAGGARHVFESEGLSVIRELEVELRW